METSISNRLYTLLATAYRIMHCGKVDRRGPRRSSVHTVVRRLRFRGYTIPIGTSPSRGRNPTKATNDSRIPCDQRSRCFDITSSPHSMPRRAYLPPHLVLRIVLGYKTCPYTTSTVNQQQRSVASNRTEVLTRYIAHTKVTRSYSPQRRRLRPLPQG